ncbi:MAG: hypothetical protein BGO51_17790 [Rhodospirillales bacterium 69-11]|jgi:DNA-binding transcriptional ArsR family regulator|nr:winged helix-turn-helix transcriptional regulator [Rhodospirillales bacterium]OJW20596.1 MAG: hypothetical protein BGO51_17790 [Rhodospirillales bacterium 69-11]
MSADPADLARAVAVLRTLANPTRLRIVMHLLQGEAAVSQIEQALGLRQPNLSQQLAELRDAGVVTSRREAKSVIYALDGAEIPALAAMLQRMFVPGAAGAPAPGGAGLPRVTGAPSGTGLPDFADGGAGHAGAGHAGADRPGADRPGADGLGAGRIGAGQPEAGPEGRTSAAVSNRPRQAAAFAIVGGAR